MKLFYLLFALPVVPAFAIVACSAKSPGAAASGDSGAPSAEGGAEAAVDAGGGDSGGPPAPVPEPPWSGTTIEPGCTVDGCVHAFAKLDDYPQSILMSAAAPGNAVLNGITEYSITYVSSGAEITGSVFVPDTPPPTGGFGVVVMNQFTSGLGASCAPSAGQLAIGVASPAALNGFVTLVPDATSYGKPPYGAYIEGQIAGRAALDGARAAFHTTQALGIAVARKAVIAGLSQGAYSTMAAATAYPSYANELEIRGFVAAEPPSNLRATLNAGLTSPVPYNHVYDAMRLYSWQGLRGLSGGPLFQAPYDTLAPPWFANDCIFNADGSNGALYDMFYEPTADGGVQTDDDAGVPIPPTSLFTSNFIGYATNDSWPADWAAEYALSATTPSYLKLPVTIFEGSDDTTVLPADVDAYVTQLKAAGVNVTYDQIPGGTHGTTALSSFTVTQVAGAQGVAAITQLLAN